MITPLTVGALINQLREYHDSDLVVIVDNGVSYRIRVDKRQLLKGSTVRVVLEKA